MKQKVLAVCLFIIIISSSPHTKVSATCSMVSATGECFRDELNSSACETSAVCTSPEDNDCPPPNYAVNYITLSMGHQNECQQDAWVETVTDNYFFFNTITGSVTATSVFTHEEFFYEEGERGCNGYSNNTTTTNNCGSCMCLDSGTVSTEGWLPLTKSRTSDCTETCALDDVDTYVFVEGNCPGGVSGLIEITADEPGHDIYVAVSWLPDYDEYEVVAEADGYNYCNGSYKDVHLVMPCEGFAFTKQQKN